MTTPAVTPLEAIGEGERRAQPVVWAGYAEDGSTYPEYDWVHPFQDQTGCVVKSKTAATSDEMFQLMSTGQYDGVSASGDSSVRLIDADLVAPVNLDLITNYADLSPFLKDTDYNSSDGKNYGVPHGWGANYLMYNTDVVITRARLVGRGVRQVVAVLGQGHGYDAPIYIADAALYLMTAQPDLGIEDPYSLNQEQFDAAVALLKDQHAIIGEYWNDYTKAQAAFEQGTRCSARRGRSSTTWPSPTAPASPRCTRRKAPPDGRDTWMISSEGRPPELHVHVDGLHHVARGAGTGRVLLR